MLAFVQEKYGLWLTDEEADYFIHFQTLTEDAQCLWVRMVNRRKNFFRLKDLQYNEIEDTEAALNLLDKKGWLNFWQANQTEYVLDLLNQCTKADLLPFDEGLKKSYSKAQIIQVLVQDEKVAQTLKQLADLQFFYPLATNDIFTKFLYFGYMHADMSQFVIRDLGNSRFEDFDESIISPRFNNRDEIDQTWTVALAYENYKLLRSLDTPFLDIYHWFYNWYNQTILQCPQAIKIQDKMILKLATHLERDKQFEYAIQLYRLTQKQPARQRLCRLYQRIGKTQSALELCQQMLDQTIVVDDYYFAEFFKKKLLGEKAVYATTARLKSAEQISVSKKWQYRPEAAAAVYYTQQGYQAEHAENWIWRSLFGLVFWPVLYDTETTAINHPFQRLPSDFNNPNFYTERKVKIDDCLKTLNNKRSFKTYLKSLIKSKFGITNFLVYWHDDLEKKINLLYNQIGKKAAKAILLQMAQQPAQFVKGFPDLWVYNDNETFFVEVKSPTDQLSFQQLFWLDFFAKQSIRAQVLKLKWEE